MQEISIQEWVDKIPQAFIPEKAAGIDADIQLRLSGDQGGDWFVSIHNQQVKASQGDTTNPKLTLNGDAQDVLNVLTGKMDPMRAFMQGKFRVTGDMSLAMKLMSIFKKP
ncbi:MAG: SCP2 sterol-binding domain-containing protein [Anaerolineaceae bacterium]|nr:SCP2 sterol-binding domain-containing protein [Anaerolineaceae bacterium]